MFFLGVFDYFFSSGFIGVFFWDILWGILTVFLVFFCVSGC